MDLGAGNLCLETFSYKHIEQTPKCLACDRFSDPGHDQGQDLVNHAHHRDPGKIYLVWQSSGKEFSSARTMKVDLRNSFGCQIRLEFLLN